MAAVALPATTATADTSAVNGRTAASPAPRAGALPVRLSPAEHAALLAQAHARRAATAKALGLGAQEELRPKSVLKDADGTVHTRYERTFAGLPVLGGDLVVHAAANGELKNVTKNNRAAITVASTAAVRTAESAKGFAVSRAKAEGGKDSTADSVRKVIWAASGKPVLAWETVVGGVQHDRTPSELHVITDAATGKKLFEYQAVENGVGNSQYSGQVTIGTVKSGGKFTLNDTTRGGHKTYDVAHTTDWNVAGTLLSDSNDIWGNGLPSDVQTPAVDVHYGAQVTWDYYKNVHGRNGIRNDGVAAKSRVHFDNNYTNAFWMDSCFCATYGDGANNLKPLTQMDVAAHELTHGLTANTAGLYYGGESGGLNEATSDIMSAAVEFWANNPADPGDYLVAEKSDVWGDGTPGRYMDEPSKDGYAADYWYAGLDDLDVHDSSGVGNHWFYLASEGSGAKTINGVNYDSPTYDGVPVTPIGRDAAAKIWYRALTVYMTSATDYAGARTATLQAATDLYGLGSATHINTAAAWAGVNVGTRISGALVAGLGDQNTLLNTAVSLQVKAVSTNPGALSYAATGLPAGLSINASTGLISGTASAVTTSPVTVTVTDSSGSTATTQFTWRVRSYVNVFENTTNVPIPDTTQLVYSTINVTGVPGNAPSDLQVRVDIKHEFRSELTIDLIAPDGTVYVLRPYNGSEQGPYVATTYTVNASSEVAAGTWKLRTGDFIYGDAGYIDSWKLTF
ncbi:M4 family metallopeptidase [Streptomyces sp. NPDC006458]|uniref:M4 family metallopeptidase n=1 Tax=Streptomyces sp. NPDC006458 TaxID=3154302 RepID=UPI0033A93E1B